MINKPTIAISRCLSGDRVRYDGREKKHAYVNNTLSKYFQLISICPEVEIGLSVPRPPMHLVRKNQSLHAVGVQDASKDFTGRLIQHAESLLPRLSSIDAYIFKARSPSCGVYSTPVDAEDALSSGIFANHVMRLIPDLPVIDEPLLDDVNLRDQFLEATYCYSAWRQMSLDALANKKQNMIETYGMRWSLRTGLSLQYLDNVEAEEFQTVFFQGLKTYLPLDQRVRRISESLRSNAIKVNAELDRRLNNISSETNCVQSNLVALLSSLEQQNALKMSADESDLRLANG